jgi:hypothetical protein
MADVDINMGGLDGMRLIPILQFLSVILMSIAETGNTFKGTYIQEIPRE